MNTLTIEINPAFRMLLWILGIFTLGVGALGMWLQTRSWPRVMDDDGITLRNGTRVRWSECTKIVRVTAVTEHGGRISGRADLLFGKTRVRLVPQSLVQGQAVLDYASAHLGQAVISG